MAIRRFVVLLLLVLGAQAPPAAGATYSWRGVASGNPGADGHTFDLAANWSPAGIPSPADLALFDLYSANNPPLQLLAPRSVATLQIAGATATLANDMPLNPSVVSLGGATGAGTLTLVSGSMPYSQWRVGDTAPGTLNVQGTASVLSSDTQIGIGAQGTVNIDGPTASWTYFNGAFTLGQGGNLGEINVTNGGTLTTAGVTGSHSKITIDGPGSSWTDTGSINTNDGPTISGGAHAQTKALGVFNAGSGLTSLVTGSGSQWVMNAQAEVGRPGIAADDGGLLTIKGGLLVDNNGFAEVYGSGSQLNTQSNLILSGGGSLLIGNHGVLTSSGMVFMNQGPQCTADVSEGAEWHYSDGLSLMGTGGTTNSIAVFGGGLLEGGPIGFPGNQGVGKIVISDAGSRWHVIGSEDITANAPNENTQIAQLIVTAGGELDCDGTLSLEYGGNIQIVSGGFLKTDQFNMTSLSNGVFMFSSSGGIIRTNRLGLGGLHPSIQLATVQLGHAYGLGSGLLTIPVATSMLIEHGVFGYDAPASVTVSGTLLGTDTVVGDQPTGDGAVLLGGSSSTTADLTVGQEGHGLFQVAGGTEDVGRHLVIAAEAGSVGTVTVGNATLTVAGDVFLGGSRAGAGGTGMLKHTGTGTTTVTDTLFVFPSDSLIVPTGQMSASVIDLMGGVLKARTHLTGKVINAGYVSCAPDTNHFTAINLTGDLEGESGSVLSLRVPSITRHDSLLVSGVMTMAGTLALDMDPGLGPHVGDHIRLATAGTFAGQFQSVTGVAPAVGFVHWSLKVESGSLFLVGEQSTNIPLPMTSGTSTALLALAILAAGVASVKRASRGHPTAG